METGIPGLRIKSGSFSRYHTVLSFIHRLIFRPRLFLHCAGEDRGGNGVSCCCSEGDTFLLAWAAGHSMGSFTLGPSGNRWIADASSSCTARSVRGRPSVL